MMKEFGSMQRKRITKSSRKLLILLTNKMPPLIDGSTENTVCFICRTSLLLSKYIRSLNSLVAIHSKKKYDCCYITTIPSVIVSLSMLWILWLNTKSSKNKNDFFSFSFYHCMYLSYFTWYMLRHIN